MEHLHDLPTPALVLDLDRLDANLDRMAARTADLGVALRPHIKTHKCVEVAERQRQRGAAGLTVATLAEARVFIDAGFDDLTWAFPVILNRIEEARELAERSTLRLLIDSLEAIDALERTGHPFHVWLKVDCGYHRAGVEPSDPLAHRLVDRLAHSRSLLFDGLLTHSGQAYEVRSSEGARAVAEHERRLMAEFADGLRADGVDVPEVSVGSTPAMSRVEHLAGVTEARPGNYAFYDYTQTVLGSCEVRECAVSVLSSVVSTRPGAGTSVVDAGALALSRDPGPAHGPHKTLGEIYEEYDDGRLSQDTRIVSLSQEHGIVSAGLEVGTRIRILPNHSCLTVAQFDEYVVARGERVVDRWRIHRQR